MTKKDKLIKKMKTNPNNISPDEIEKVLEWEGFERRKSNAGSHKVFKRKSDGKVFNLVLARNPVKKYQVEDLLKILDGED
ncbi:type II toxin-antitoxin system HicA family toxin [Anaerococcus tetradius]|uniref:type II toxin-antitoxin system HicA family toxin n=1 Tax=Anaerococcus tetradius TaxID=33036 RepID=UPI000317489D|nr:type II toxin-antitoxin system HicA family toxin [Anaerococcus tetradius]